MDHGEGASSRSLERLPDGWIVKSRRRKDGRVDRYYVSPESGRTFRSRAEALRYLNSESSDLIEADVKQDQSSPLSLPCGWIMEIRTRKSGVSAGKKYKVYCDPFTGHIFYSKKDVFRHLKAEKSSEFTSKKRKPLGAKPEEDRFSKFASNQNHFSVDFSEDATVETFLVGSGERPRMYSGKEQKACRRTEEEDDVLILGSLSSPPPSSKAAPQRNRRSKRSCKDYPDGELAQLSRSGEKSEQLGPLTRRASKRLAGLEPTMPSPPSTEAAPRGGRGAKSEQLTLLTGRALKRHAAIEARPTANIEASDRTQRRGRPPTRSRGSHVPTPFIDLCDPETDPLEVEDGSP